MRQLYLLYIDPGTGSALFGILIGAGAAIYFLAHAVLIKLKTFFSGGRAVVSSEHNIVIYNEGRHYWNVFKPILDEFEARHHQVSYLTSAQDDPSFGCAYEYVKAEYIGEGNRAFARLNLLRAGVVLMTTPGLDVYQLKRSKGVKHYAHILHMPSDATTYRLFGLDYFDSILLTGDYQADDIRELERQRGLPAKKLVTVGCTYLDVYAEKIKKNAPEENHPFTVLVSPSWGASALLSRYGEALLDPLAQTEWRVIIRPHPQSKKSEAAMLERLEGRYKNSQNMQWDYNSDNSTSLSRADVMISDFSGIIFDFMFLCDKPVLYVSADFDARPYDAGDIEHELWQFRTVKEAGIELKPNDFSQIVAIVKNASEEREGRRASRQKAREEAWQHQGGAGKRVCDFLIEASPNV